MSSFQAKNAVVALALFLFLICWISPAAAAIVTYEIYTLQPGDTQENLALRQGLKPDEVLSIDDGPWQAGKRVALLKRYSELPGAPKPAAVEGKGARLASVVRGGSDIRSQPASAEAAAGAFLFRPETGSKMVVVDETATHYGVIMADHSTGWIEKSAVSIEGPIDSDWLQNLLTAGRPEVVEEAFRYLGLPYRYGGNLPYNTDCSLLVQNVFRAQGANLPRTAAEQSEVGMAVSLSDMKPGDRLYFINNKGRISHTGIYIGSGLFVHASSNRGSVAVDNLAGSYLRRLVAIRRL